MSLRLTGKFASETRRVRLLWPQLQARWLHDLLRDNELRDPHSSSSSSDTGAVVVGFATVQLQQRNLCDPLVLIDREVRWLLEFYHHPKDAFSMTIQTVQPMASPQMLQDVHFGRRPGLCFTMHEHPAITLPVPIAQLVVKGRWSHLLGLLRWKPLASACPQHWFAQQRDAVCQHDPPAKLEDLELSSEKMEELAEQIRSWAPSVLNSPAGPDERMELESAITYLTQCARALRGSASSGLRCIIPELTKFT